MKLAVYLCMGLAIPLVALLWYQSFVLSVLSAAVPTRPLSSTSIYKRLTR